MTDLSPVELTVLLPAYNEGSTVRNAVERYVHALQRCCRSFEILVIDDGSTDDTRRHAEEAARGDPRVRVMANERNLGQVASLVRGFAVARGEVVMHNGVDLPFNPDDTAKVLARIHEGADVVVVERTNREAYGAVRKVVSWCNMFLVKVLLGSPFRDHNFTQAYRRRVLAAVTIESRGVSTVTPELILKARQMGFAVDRVNVPYTCRRSGKSTITVRKIVHTVAELFRLAVIMHRAKRRAPARVQQPPARVPHGHRDASAGEPASPHGSR